MWTYILRRIFIAIPLIIGLATVTFFIIHLAPGDPMALYRNPEISPEVMELMRKNLGLDQPLHIQYVRWLTSMARGNFGISFTAHRPVADILKEAIPNTMQLTLLALLLNLIAGQLKGQCERAEKSHQNRGIVLAKLVTNSGDRLQFTPQCTLFHR